MPKRKSKIGKFFKKHDWKFYTSIFLTLFLFSVSYLYPSVVVVVEKATAQHGINVGSTTSMTFTVTSTVTFTRTTTTTETLTTSTVP